MGSFSSKDGHGTTGHNLDVFQTPPTSPVTFSLPPNTPIAPSTPAQTENPHQSAAFAPAHPAAPPPASAPDLNVRRPVPGFIYPQGRTGNDVASIRERVEVGHNGGPVSSTPKTPVPEGKSVAISPTNSPLSLGEVSPSGESCKDSGLCQSLLEGHGDADSLELERLVEECRTALGLTPSQYAVLNSADVLKRLLLDRQELTAELQSLKETTQTERGEWLQFQADLQVAVAVADRLRAEAEEELSALRIVQKDVEQELAAAKHRQNETDEQLVTLRGDLMECRQKLAQISLNQGSGPAQSQGETQSQESATGETSTPDTREGILRGRDRGIRRQGRERGHEELEKRSKDAGMESVLVEKARADAKGVENRDLKNVTNQERSREERHGTKENTKDIPRIVTQERSRSLSRLPMSSDSPAVQNGTSQSNTSTLAGSTNKVSPLTSQSQTVGRRGLERQDSWSSTHTGKQEEALNQHNLRPDQAFKTRPQDGFSLLLRRHGGSRRNSLLRWCQCRTQGYKNIDITNFSSSWADGLAFCAVYHTYLPSHIPYSTLSPDSKRENLSLAFKTGENVGIPTSVSIEEMLRPGGPDWQRVLGYVESMYRHFEM
ncbi:hypothetical protein UPYG_G00224940 [Umbra pygmaea]|uniref:Cytospin-A n=1 Tax=Umbra pygmaea TaxID=75934 RepID=A0ABD0WCA4_UMBPY